METIPYWQRATLLVVVMAVISLVELRIKGRDATRWREYTFVLLAGFVASIFGLFNDLLTSAISPDYFIFGKELPADNLRHHAAILGLKAGFSAGVTGGGVCVYIMSRKSPFTPLAFRRLTLLSWRPFLLAPCFALLFSQLLSNFDPLGFTEDLEALFAPPRIARLIRVWWIHLGLYTGLLAGVVWIAVEIVRGRKRGLANHQP